ncbi:hypothetical protein [uncultured Sphingomonas sp.]|uniref:hypothetical protein n=1 Tax=uncultured Sphingomonas sp. TaxID=158754 RepID=UPI0035CA0536
MAMMMSSLYDALRTAGAGDESARKAAEEVAGFENRFAKVEGELAVLKWMVGFDLALTAAVLAKLLTLGA